MSWEDQGRQEHGWFGHGTAPPKLGDDPGERSVMAGLDARIRTLGHCAIADIPRKLRYHHAASFPEPVMEQLIEAMGTWARGLLLDRAEFAARFFGRTAFDPVVDHLWQATKYAVVARSPAEVQAGTYQLAGAMQAVGLDNWRRFLSDVQQRAAASDSAGLVNSISRDRSTAPAAPHLSPNAPETTFAIDGVYRRVLGRGASVAELAACKEVLAGGASLNDLRAAIGAASAVIARPATLVSYVPLGSVTPPVGAPVDPYKEGYVPLSQVPTNARGILKYRVFFYDKGTGTYKVGFSFPNNSDVLPTLNKRGKVVGDTEVGFTVVPPDSPPLVPDRLPASAVRVGFLSYHPSLLGQSYFVVYNSERQTISPVTGKYAGKGINHYPLDTLKTFTQ